jgi:carbon monoxide dehydrogenase subunit G
MPGAQLLERKGDDAYQVQVRVKVGPMSMSYRGTVEITERDQQARAAAMRVQAREARGQGTANATVHITLSGDGAGTEAVMATDLRLSGRAATMGRGVIGDVSQSLISEFAGNLQALLAATSGTAGGDRSDAAASAPPRALDATQLARGVVANRLQDSGISPFALLAAGLLGFLLGRVRRR